LFVGRVDSIRTWRVVWTLFVLASSLWALIFLRRPVHQLTPTLTTTGGLLVLVLVVYLLPPALVPSTAKVEDADRLKAVGDVRTALVQALGGAALVGTLYFSAASLEDSRINTNRTLDLNRQGQIADRFTRAVAQTGRRRSGRARRRNLCT
jgi:predicted transporter